ncbi:MAG TPA: hypothetical protein VFU29_01660 [Chitinophagaceae bacterium]|nr:hypothetical protein [Chitinophagaceae bacterium]
MKTTLIALLFTITLTSAHAQLTKGNWLVGGTGNFLASKNSYSTPTSSSSSDRIDIKISPAVGYFVVDKLSIGLRPSFSKYKDVVDGTGGNINSNINRFEIGPFLRYYFLEADKQYNILADFGYQYGFYWFKPTKGSINTFSANAGTVIFFNTVVGGEFLVGYYQRKEVIKQNGDFITNQKGLQISLGFQIHLEKE